MSARDAALVFALHAIGFQVACAQARPAARPDAPRADSPRIVAHIGDLAVTTDAFASFVLDERGSTTAGAEVQEALIQERVVEAEAERRGVTVDDAAVDARIPELDRRLQQETGGKLTIESVRASQHLTPEEFRAKVRNAMLAERMMGDDFGLRIGDGVAPEKQSLWYRDQNRPAVKRDRLPAGVVADVAGRPVRRTDWGIRLFFHFKEEDQNALFEDYVGIALLLRKGRQLKIEVTPAMIQTEVDERSAVLRKLLVDQGMPTDDVDFLSTIKARGDDPDVVLKSDRMKAEILLKEIARELHGRDGFKSYYAAHRADFDQQFGRKVRLSTLFLLAAPAKSAQVPRTWAEATAELDRLKDRLASDPASLAAAFASQARIHSEDAVSAKAGGDLGLLGLKELELHGFQSSLLDATTGGMIGPLNTPKGVHLLLIGDKADASPFEAIRDEVEKAARRELLRDLKKDVKIVRDL